MNFKELLLRAKAGRELAVMALLEMYKPLLVKILKERQLYEKNRNRRRERFRVWTMFVAPAMAEQGAMGFIAHMINSFLLKNVYGHSLA